MHFIEASYKGAVIKTMQSLSREQIIANAEVQLNELKLTNTNNQIVRKDIYYSIEQFRSDTDLCC